MSRVNPKTVNHQISDENSRIDEVIYNLGREFGRTILLIDRFDSNPLSEAFDNLACPALSLSLDDPIFEDEPTRAPLIIELRQDIPCHIDLLEKSVELALEQSVHGYQAPQICAWLYTTASLERMQSEMRKKLDVCYPGGKRIYFRFFDPRVMHHLARIFPHVDFENGQQSSFSELLGAIQIWCQISRAGTPMLFRSNNARGISKIKGLRIDKRTADAIDRIALVNRVVKELALMGKACRQDDDHSIDGMVLDSEKFGIIDVEDKVAYAWRAWFYKKEFTQQPDLKSRIEKALSQGLPLEIEFEDQFPPFSIVDGDEKSLGHAGK